MYFVFQAPIDLEITEVSGRQHEIKNVTSVSMSPMGTNQFTLRVEYNAVNTPFYATVPGCVLLALIDYAEVQRIEKIYNDLLENGEAVKRMQKSISE